MSARSRVPSGTPRRWRVHLVLLGLVLAQLAYARAVHRTDEELVDLWAPGESRAAHATGPVGRAQTRGRLDLAHKLLARASSSGAQLGRGYLAMLAATESPDGIRELAFSSDVCKFSGPRTQLQWVVEGLDAGRPRAFVDFILQCRKVGGEPVGGSSAMRRKELEWYYEARRVEEWPEGKAEEIRGDLAPWLDPIRAYLERR